MSRTTTIFGFVFVSLVSVFATGCMGESEDPNSLIWYDDEMDACFTTNEKGQKVQVPCDESSAMPGLEESASDGAGCTGTACCQTKSGDPGFCR